MAYDMSRTVELVRTGDDAVSFSEVRKLKESSDFYCVTGYSEMISTVSNRSGITETGIKVVLTDAEYSSVYIYEMLAGSFPGSRAVSSGEACAVISDELAVRLFKSTGITSPKPGPCLNIIWEEKFMCTG